LRFRDAAWTPLEGSRREKWPVAEFFVSRLSVPPWLRLPAAARGPIGLANATVEIRRKVWTKRELCGKSANEAAGFSNATTVVALPRRFLFRA
jgi:hypothetical protein